ncbi:MAG: DUF4175 domain-containing protein [Actinobacteria bacterium]|nr:DUF4175 domain-containing protein [Actinomycetota bacterium]
MPRGLRPLAAVAAVTAMLFALMAVRSIDSASPETSTSVAVENTAPPATIRCFDVVYGDDVVCVAANADGHDVAWPDGTVTAASGLTSVSYAVPAVGELAVELVGADGLSVASDVVTISPDFELVCEVGDLAPIYEIVPWDGNSQGWDYVYTDPVDGRQVVPGDADHPSDPSAAFTDYNRNVIDEANATGECEITSAARDDFGGKTVFEMQAPYEEPLRVPFKALLPFSRSNWSGVQPGDMTVTITVEGVDASERRGVFLSGCT